MAKVINGGNYWDGHAICNRSYKPVDAWKFISYGKKNFHPITTSNLPYGGSNLAHVFLILPDGNLYKLSLADFETLEQHRR